MHQAHLFFHKDIHLCYSRQSESFQFHNFIYVYRALITTNIFIFTSLGVIYLGPPNSALGLELRQKLEIKDETQLSYHQRKLIYMHKF